MVILSYDLSLDSQIHNVGTSNESWVMNLTYF